MCPTPMLKMNEDGSCIYYTGSHDMGTDTLGMQMQIVSEVLGISMDRIECIQADTDATMYDLGNYSSRGTYVSCNAAVKAAGKIRQELTERGGPAAGRGTAESGTEGTTGFV